MSQKRNNSIQQFNRKLKKSIRKAVKQFKILLQTQGKWLLRCLLITKKIPQISLSLIKKISNQVKQVLGKLIFSPPKTSLYKSKGFILPTIAIVLLVFALVVGSIIFRSANRTEQVVNERQKQIADTATTPAVQRAKAKLAYLFNDDKDYPNGLASGTRLNTILEKNSYDFPGETRIDVNGDGVLDTAWKFERDIDGDGKNETIAYSILTLSEIRDENDPNKTLFDITSLDEKKADNLIVRNAPISLKEASAGCESSVNSQGGWYPNSGSSSNFLRAFQVNAVAIKNDNGDRAYTALQLQQDRESDLGNKWGAWFLNDLEIFPGPDFRWNGAMHTEGNLIIGNSRVRSFLISAPQSCLYSRSNSEVTLAQFDGEGSPPDPTKDNGGRVFQGQIISGKTVTNKANDNNRDKSKWDIFDSPNPITGQGKNDLNANSDAIDNTNNIAPRLIDPVLLFTEGLKQTRGVTSDLNNPSLPSPAPQTINTTEGNTKDVNTSWPDRDLVTSKRIFNNPEKPPFVDDFYRADNRYGTKPRYTDAIDFPFDTAKNYIRKSGNEIRDDDYLKDNDPENDEYPTTLTNIKLDEKNYDNFGLDGYWERRAWGEGLRIIVGQRLELGNAYGWGTSEADSVTGEPDPDQVADQDPLYPPYDATVKSGGRLSACKYYTTSLGYSKNNIDKSRCHEHRQWKTLRDNLAAVQATAVYTNYKDDTDITKREFPVACIATTAHPGTRKTIDDSTIFNFYPGTPDVIDTNFLQGKGTNGWEFNPPGNFTSEIDFASAINDKTSPLRKALTNLAYFAGDPDGAFPAKQENGTLGNDIIHPYPYTMMWGDFSNLRRVIDILDGKYTDTRPDGTSFTPNYTYKTVSLTDSNINDLSIADKTTLQTASCTLGMLAYNLDNIEKYSSNTIQELNNKLANLYDSGAKNLPSDDNDNNNNGGNAQVYRNDFGAADEYLINQIELIEQVRRDRLLGFKPSDPASIPPTNQNYTLSYVSNFQYGGRTYNSGQTLSNLKFDFSSVTGNNYFGLGAPDNPTKEQEFIRLALLIRDIINNTNKDLAEDFTKPKYPSLHYIFPIQDHTISDDRLDEEYVANIRKDIPSNRTHTYEKINTDPNNFDGVKIDPRILSIPNPWQFQCAVTSTAPQIPCVNDSKIENKIILPDDTPDDLSNNPIAYVTLLDKGIFNGREQMSVRTLDIDLNLLRHNLASDMKENWLPDSGIVYAFREDAMREDGIERPRQGEFSGCNTLDKITNVNITSSGNGTTPNCVMDAVGSLNGKQQDPPLEDKKSISPKPIDIYPDPDRRPNGFRLRNGRDLRRCHSDFGNGTGEKVTSGLSFITDNPTYVQADRKGFNLHVAVDRECDNSSYSDSNRIEEFKTKLNNNFNNFYSRGGSGADPKFAREGDTWRPTTVLADSVSILSNKFFDGTIADGLIQPKYTNTKRNVYKNELISNASQNYPYPQSYFNSLGGLTENIPSCSSDKCTSYFNLKYPRWPSNNDNNDRLPKLVREDGSISDGNYPNDDPNPNRSGNKGDRIDAVAEDSPVKISRNGYVIYDKSTNSTPDPQEFGNDTSGNSDNFRSFQDSNKLIKPDSGNRVNAVIISGLIPSRATQSYGGLHNFPRFNEAWSGKDLFISGSLLQLNFSTTGTAPFDQDSWEPSHRPSGSKENIKYYGAPNRRWGYDVGLQLAPAGPVEERFVTNSGNLSEFFQQLPIDDPYIKNLRCGKDESGDLVVDPTVDTSQCPNQ